MFLFADGITRRNPATVRDLSVDKRGVIAIAKGMTEKAKGTIVTDATTELPILAAAW